LKSLHTLLDQAREAHADKEAFSLNGVSYTYKEFYAKVFGIAHALEEEHQRIAVVINHDIETYATILAIWWTGKTYLPIDEAQFHAIEAGIKEWQPDVVCSSLGDDFYGYNFLHTSGLSSANRTDCFGLSRARIAYVLATSGTTGPSKKIPISYSNLDAFVDSFLSIDHSMSSTDRFIQQADLCFDMSIISFLVPLCLGASVHPVAMEGIRYVEVLRTLMEQRITVFMTAPSTLELLQPYYEELELPDLRITFSGAEALLTATAEKWHQCSPNGVIVNLYGASEGGIFSSWHTWSSREDRALHVPIGRAVKHMIHRIEDSFGQPLEGEGEGELLIRGAQVFAGYEDTALNTDAFVQADGHRWYYTGDMVRVNSKGQMTFMHRTDHQVKLQGKRIELDLIQHFAHALWPESAVHVELTSASAGKKLVLQLQGTVDPEQAQEQLKSVLPAFYPPIEVWVKQAFAGSCGTQENLFALLDKCAASKMVVQRHYQQFRTVDCVGSSWPHFIYGIQLSQASIDAMVQAIREGHAPGFVILDAEQATAFEEPLMDAGFIPLMEWSCMRMDNTLPIALKDFDESISFEEVQSEVQMAEWIQLAGVGFGALDYGMFEVLSEQNVTFYLGRKGGKAVVTCMVDYFKGSAGIYYLVTHPDYRQMGVGSAAIAHCRQQILNRGREAIRVQATQASYSTWKRMGMEDCGSLYLFKYNDQ